MNLCWGLPSGLGVVKHPPANAVDGGRSLSQEGSWRRKRQPTLAFLPGKLEDRGAVRK